MSLVSVRDLTKRFGATDAVRQVSFEITQPGIVGLIGPNGAGKTTLLRMLATYYSPTAGQILIRGMDAACESRRVRESIGYLSENPAGYLEARVEEYLRFRAGLKGLARRDQSREIDRCLGLCDLQSVRRRLIGRLSLGYRRRVGLADALLNRPAILLLDEPTIGLDPLQICRTRQLLQEVGQQSVVLLSTHLLSEAQESCDRVLMFQAGKLIADLDRNQFQSTADSLEQRFLRLVLPSRDAA
jgi:ABC-2 type transport system ATP-binding protein